LIERDELIKRLKQENEELITRFDDLNVHINSMMTYLEPPVVNENIIPKEKFSSNTNLDFFKENLQTNYLSINISSNSRMIKDPLKNSESNEKTEENLNEKKIESFEKKSQSKFLPWPLPEMDYSLIDLISENILQELKCHNSINIYNINKTLLSGTTLSAYINTIFLNEAMSNLTLSIYHEYIQTIFIHIYLSLLKAKPEKISNHNSHNKSKFSCMVSEEIDKEVISKTVEEIYSIYCNLDYKTKLNGKHFGIQNIEIFFEKTFDHKPFSKDSRITKLRQEILSSFMKKVKIFEDAIKEDLFNIVKLCRNFIHAGKIIHRNKIIFDYWKLHSEIKFCNLININTYDSNSISELSENVENKIDDEYHNNNRNKLVYIHSSEEAETVYNLQNYLKFHWEGLETIEIKRNFKKSESDKVDVNSKSFSGSHRINPLGNILSSILSNSNILNQIKSFKLNHFDLTENDIFLINCIIEFAKNLNKLDLSSICLEDKWLRSISEVMKSNKSITDLYLHDNCLTSNGAFYLTDMLLKNESITHLYLDNNNITGMGLQSLINIISNGNKSIKHLDLSDNKLTNNDVIIISNLIIKNCQHFEGLNLSNNILDLDSVNTLGHALKTNVFLKQLYLNNIGLNIDSTPYFFQFLVEANLREISLDNNNLGEIGGVLFANVIKSNNHLRKVSLKNTQLNHNSMICISHALEIEMSKGIVNLKFINLEDNMFDDNSISTLINSFLALSKNFNSNKNSYEFSKRNIIDYPFIILSLEMLSEKSLEMIKVNKLGFIQFN